MPWFGEIAKRIELETNFTWQRINQPWIGMDDNFCWLVILNLPKPQPHPNNQVRMATKKNPEEKMTDEKIMHSIAMCFAYCLVEPREAEVSDAVSVAASGDSESAARLRWLIDRWPPEQLAGFFARVFKKRMRKDLEEYDAAPKGGFSAMSDDELYELLKLSDFADYQKLDERSYTPEQLAELAKKHHGKYIPPKNKKRPRTDGTPQKNNKRARTDE